MPLHLDNLTAYPEQVCEGEGAQLSAMVFGGIEELTFNWTPGESLSDSTVSNPFATPSHTTLYTLEVHDGQDYLSEQIQIVVNPLPEVDLGEDLEICRDHVELLDAGDHYSYLWNDGSTARFKEIYYPDYQTDQADIWVEAGNSYGCRARDSIIVVFEDCVNVPETHTAPFLACYPNPARDRIVLEFSEEKPQWVKLFNLSGEKVKSVDAPPKAFGLDVRSLTPGTYLLVFKTAEGVNNKKIVIMR